MTFLADVNLALRILAVAFVYMFVASNIPNKLLGTIAFLFLAYYIIFAQWDIWSLVIIGFLIFSSGHLLGFVQDMAFQYSTVEHLDMPMEEGAAPASLYMLTRMGIGRRRE